MRAWSDSWRTYGGLPDGVEARGLPERPAVAVEEDLGELELPVEEAVLSGDAIRRGHPALELRRYEGRPARGVVPQRGPHAGVHLDPEPGRGREVREAGVAAGEVLPQAGVELLLLLYVLDRVSGALLDQPDAPDRARHAPPEGVVPEHGELVLVGLPRLLALAGAGAEPRDTGSHQRVAAPEVVVQERERPVPGDGREPQGELGEVHRERVQVHPVDAGLHYSPLPVRELRLPGLLPGCDAELDQEPGHVLRDLHQEVPAPHRGVQHVQGEHGLRLLFRLPPFDGPPQDGADRLLDDVLDDVVRGVVAAGTVTFALLVQEVYRPVLLAVRRFQVVLQEALVDGAEMPLGEVAIVHELPVHAGEAVDGPLEVRPADDVPLQERVLPGVEEAAVEGGDAQGGASPVYDAEQLLEARPERPALRQPVAGSVEVSGHAALDGVEAVALAVHPALTHRQQLAGLGVEDEEQPVEDYQGVVVDLREHLRVVAAEPVLRVVEEALGQVPQGLVDLGLQRVAHAPGVLRALVQECPGAHGAVVERGAPEEGVEVEEGCRVSGLQERGQVHLVEDVQLVGGVAVIESPEPAVGQDAPLHARVAQVEGDLVRRVLVGELVPGPAVGDVERAVPVLGVPDRERPGGPQNLLCQGGVLVGVHRGFVAVEDVVRAFGAAGGGEGRLDLERVVPEDPEDRPDQVSFRLRLVGRRHVGPEDLRHRPHYRFRLSGQRRPAGASGEGLVEVVVAEEPPVAVQVLGARWRVLRPAGHARIIG